MSSPSSSSTTVAFFGATGGVTNAALAHTLKAGYKVIALVRNREKLCNLLASQGFDEVTIAKHLTIVEGNALDVAAVKRTLTAGADGALPTHIVTGLGSAGRLTFNWCHPGNIVKLDNPTICETAAQTLLTAMREIYAEKPWLSTDKPLLIFISTTGVTRGPDDVPFAMRFLYHQMLAIPHADKMKMEDAYRADAEKDDDAVFRNIVGIRPTLLTGGASYTDAVGLDHVKYGTESHPATGFSIKRADVGHWVFENLIDEAQRRKELEGEMITLTS
ncbi:hypothetical protein A1O3_02186 [Capronia epimyces CBS 606.96]|uniref:NAD(P)-binding domain-containing protein n=1 Tax=Capronia epimyces CBS 606.96 TaxID=1182542 RepID=W9Y8E2_9EURO|nr:uncharacterized protein A1O3_02186 [Capronia epimyces CBS 606.96]EXJ89122.1 hypothetical protein A1O3_02186 [Capronia epimyces CBS 606.96]